MERLWELPAISHFMRDGFISTECVPQTLSAPFVGPQAPKLYSTIQLILRPRVGHSSQAARAGRADV